LGLLEVFLGSKEQGVIMSSNTRNRLLLATTLLGLLTIQPFLNLQASIINPNSENGLFHNQEQAKDQRIFEFNFLKKKQGWRAGFADSTSNLNTNEKVEFKRKKLPSNLANDLKALFIAGTNRTDDLFMFIKRQLTGLKPNSTYQLRFQIQIATNAPSGCVGAGGSSGDSVYLKSGGTSIEPVVDPNTRLLNIDKGNQSQGGRDMVLLGTIGNSSGICFDTPYEFKNFDSQSIPFEATTDANGRLWIIIGTDSGFEGRTELFYSKIVITLVEK
jgi:hypothetical protein